MAKHGRIARSATPLESLPCPSLAPCMPWPTSTMYVYLEEEATCAFDSTVLRRPAGPTTASLLPLIPSKQRGKAAIDQTSPRG